MDLPEARSLGLVSNIAHPAGGTIPNVGPPMHFSRTPLAAPVAAPMPGADTEAVLAQLLNYSPERVRELAARGFWVRPARGRRAKAVRRRGSRARPRDARVRPLAQGRAFAGVTAVRRGEPAASINSCAQCAKGSALRNQNAYPNRRMSFSCRFCTIALPGSS